MLEITHSRLRRNENNPNYFSPPTISGSLRGSRTAEANGIITHGYAPALALCRKLLAAGIDPRTKLNLFRKPGTLALRIRSVGEGAQLCIDGDGARFERLPEPSKTRPAASPVRRNEAALGGVRSDPSDASDEGVS